MPDKTNYLTSEGRQKLKDELGYLKKTKRSEMAIRIKEAKELGDLSENAEYADAREEQSFVEGRILELEEILKNAQLIDANISSPGAIDIGDTIIIKKDGNKYMYTIVGSNEANPSGGRISNESPLGKSFLGGKKGESVEVKTPRGTALYEIIEIKKK